MEAAWLAAVILIPVFFNVYSSRIFEPDKIAILRTLGLVILVAWVVKLIEAGGFEWEKFYPAEGQSAWRYLLRFPLLAPVLGLVGIYVLATIFSVTPRVSFWGSYQRLQGTYTTLSYLIIFAAMAVNLRRRVQVERLITTAILSSLPVALYGMLQRYGLDPVPWGGDVSVRIAANMGNSIFVAAYLIMVFPLTVGRALNTFRAILSESGSMLAHVARGTVYVFIGALQVIAIYMSGSRGPALGWIIGIFVLALLLTLVWRKRWMAFTIVGLAVLVAGFLFVFNLENGPLESLRSLPGVGRFGRLLDPESNSALVREYIWQGAAQLVLPHAPLEYPDGSQDPFNILRPLIGYGPESMYVAYNPFYPPELGTVERRNASPDRSHNETWDSVVITGVIGLFAYLAVFTAVFYYGLKWLGLIGSKKRRNLFFLIYFLSGAAGALGLILWRGFEYAGVGLPFGLLFGLIVYLALEALFPAFEAPQTIGDMARALTLAVLLAAVISHFAEINFGIAIAATRTYFWIYAALLLLVGLILPVHGQYEESVPLPAVQKSSGRKSKSAKKVSQRRRSARTGSQTAGFLGLDWSPDIFAAGFVLAILLTVMGFDHLTTSLGGKTTSDIIWTSLSSLRGSLSSSFGILALLLTSWIAGAVLFASESCSVQENGGFFKFFAAVLGISGLLGLVYWLMHAGALATLATFTASNISDVIDQVGRYEGLLTRLYTYILLLIFGAAFFLPQDWPVLSVQSGWLAVTMGPVFLVLALVVSSLTNIRPIQADVAFKLAEPFTHGDQWPVAIEIYNHANDLAPSEDYYYLFLGKAYFEYGKTLDDPAQRDQLFAQAEHDMQTAQDINPLNTDHTANLARIYSLWATYSDDPQLKQQRAMQSAQYFEKAVTLSPHNSRLWDEWALLYINVLDQPEQALQRLTHSLNVDPYNDWTYGILGDFYARTVSDQSSHDDKQAALRKAKNFYNQAIERVNYWDKPNKYAYTFALAGVYTQLGELDQAIDTYSAALKIKANESDKWRVEENIARLQAQKGNMDGAIQHAQNAFISAPEDQKQRIQGLIVQLQNQQ
jgi:tetratricopeptide (TPR) repeat protein/O-antigen ligase